MDIITGCLSIAVLALCLLVIHYKDKASTAAEVVEYLRRENFRLFQKDL